MILEKKLLPRLINELKIQAYLSHPNIIQLYGSFHDHDNIYVLMELGSEGQLYTKLKRKERYSEYGALLIIRDLLASVNHMHSKKLLHRDIKPENIVVVHVTRSHLLRAPSNCAISGGQSIAATTCATPSAGRLCTSPPSSSPARATTRRWICGPSASCPSSWWWAAYHSKSRTRASSARSSPTKCCSPRSSSSPIATGTLCSRYSPRTPRAE